MAHFAKVVDGIVEQVIVADQGFVNTLDGNWVKTSFNTRGGKHYDPETGAEDHIEPLRKNFASVGDVYDATRDAFYEPQPYPSWTLNETTCMWESPVPHPDSSIEAYVWDEEGQSWLQITDYGLEQ